MKIKRTTLALATAGLTVAMSGVIGLVVPSAAAAAGTAYATAVTACEGDLVSIPTEQFLGTIGDPDPLVFPAGDWTLAQSDIRLNFISAAPGNAWVSQTDFSGIGNDTVNFTYQIPADFDWDTYNGIWVGTTMKGTGVPQPDFSFRAQNVTISRAADCDPVEPSPTSSTSQSPTETCSDAGNMRMAAAAACPDPTSSAAPTTSNVVAGTSSSEPQFIAVTSVAVAPTTSALVPPPTVVPSNTVPRSVTTSGPLDQGQAWSLLLLVGGAMVLVLAGVVAVRRRS